MPFRTNWPIFAALVLTVFPVARSFAGITLSIGDVGVIAGGAGIADVIIESDEANGEEIAFYDLEFLLTPLDATPGTALSFSAVQPQSFLAETAYLFAGNSFSVNFELDSTFTDPLNHTTLLATDSRDPQSNETLVGSKLLTRTRLEHRVPAGVDLSTLVDDQFNIEVTSAAIDVYSNGTLTPYSGSVDFSSIGLVTITPIPEPSSILPSVLCSLLITARHRAKRL